LVPLRSEDYLAQSCDSSCAPVRVVIVRADGHGGISRRPKPPVGEQKPRTLDIEEER